MSKHAREAVLDNVMSVDSPRRRVWRMLLLLLMTAVVFVTTYALILPAITLTEEPQTVLEGDLSTTVSYKLVKTGEDYTLTVSGTGKMVNYSSSKLANRPWHSYIDKITAFVAEDGITSIGAHVCNGATSLQSVRIPEGVTTICGNAFTGATSLQSVRIPEGVTTIDDAVFKGCLALRSVELPNTLTTLGASVFVQCTSLESVKLPDSITSMGGHTFSGCTALTTAHFPDNANITAIPNDTFHNCSSLTTVNIPDHITSFISSAFQGCVALKEVDWPDSLTTIGRYVFYQCNAFQSIKLPDTVTTIQDAAFGLCKGLKTVELPASVTSIGSSVFGGCYALETVDFEEGSQLTSIGNHAFSGCPVLTSIELPDTVTSIGKSAFQGCTKLPSINIPAGVTRIEENTFRDCTSLEDVTFAEGSAVTYIGTYAFQNDQNLHSINLPDTVTTIDAWAFGTTTSLTDLKLPASLTTIEERAFDTSGLLNVDLPESVTAIKTYTFYNSQLESITIPSTVDQIDSYAFSRCRNLKTLVWDAKTCATVDADGNRYENALPTTVFEGGLANDFTLTIGSSVERLPDNFGLCVKEGLVGEVHFAPNDRIELPAAAMAGFDYPLCTLDGDYYVDEFGVIYDSADKTTLYYCPPGIETFTVPATVTTIAPQAFALAHDLTAVTFADPSAVTSIGSRAFYRCEKLTAVNSKSTVEGATALFAQGVVAADAYEQTGLTDSDTLGERVAQNILVVDHDVTLTVLPPPNVEPDESGLYTFLTGENGEINVAATISTEDAAERLCRVYLDFSDSDFALNFNPGETITIETDNSSFDVTMKSTDRPGVYYLEFAIKAGETVTFSVNPTYPSLTTDGGYVRVWADVLAADEESDINALPERYLECQWTTEKQEYTTAKSSPSGVSQLIGSGKGDQFAYYYGTLSWNISLTATEPKVSELYGRDPLEQVTYTDEMVFPEGMYWSEELLAAVRAGNYTILHTNNIGTTSTTATATLRYQTASGTMQSGIAVAFTTAGNNTRLVPLSLEVTADNRLLVTWRVYSRTVAEDPTVPTVKFNIYKDAVETDLSVYNNTKAQTVKNYVTTVSEYLYSDPVTAEAVASWSVPVPKTNVFIKKTVPDYNATAFASYAPYMGETLRYSVTVSNTGALPSSGTKQVVDELNTRLYISPQNIQRMLDEQVGGPLTIQITDANLFTPVSGTAIATDGSTAVTLNTANSSKETEPTEKDVTLTIQKVEGGYAINGTLYESVQAGFDEIGYVVTADDQYHVLWDFSEFVLYGGTSYSTSIYTTHKNTFQMLPETDWLCWYHYPNENIYPVSNQAVLYGTTTNKYSGTLNHNVSLDLKLFETVKVNGQSLTGEEFSKINLQDGDWLDYTMDIRHLGTGVYDDLPIVNRLTGAQVLLAPAKENAGQPWAEGLTTIERNGVSYYVLDKAGTYTGVWVGTNQSDTLLYADTVTVSETDNGYTTLVKWYREQLTGKVNTTITFPVKVTTDGKKAFNVSSYAYLNDRTADRLYASLGGSGAVLHMNKKLVSANAGEETERLDEDNYSILDVGSSATYKLTLTATGSMITLSNEDIFDRLPQTFGEFAWNEENVAVKVVCDDEDTTAQFSNWYITDEPPSDRWEKETGQYYLRWRNESMTVEAGKSLVIYVTLTYPETQAAWDSYCDKAAGNRLQNSLYVYEFSADILHDLRTIGEVLLQKGVYCVQKSLRLGDTGGFPQRITRSSRQQYANSIKLTGRNTTNYTYSEEERVVYYVALYNGGNTRLYLSDLQDQLPAGFTFHNILSTANDHASGSRLVGMNYNNKIGSAVGSTQTRLILPNETGYFPFASVSDEDLSDVEYCSAKVKVTLGENGKLTFQVAESDEADSIAYDEEEDRCYLAKGQALVFGYVVGVSSNASKTEDFAINTIAMPYYDPVNGDVILTDARASGTEVSPLEDKNDGTCAVISRDDAAKEGFTTGDEMLWLRSQVMLQRAEILPGVSKSIVSKIDSGNTETSYINSANVSDTLKWQVRVENSGEGDINDYTVTDTMQSPYCIVDRVSYTLYQNDTPYYKINNLFTVVERSGNTVTITDHNGSVHTITTDGSETTVPVSYELYNGNGVLYSTQTGSSVTVRVTVGADGSESWAITFPNGLMPIHSGAYGILSLYTKNLTQTKTCSVYANQAMFSPLASYDGTAVQRGINITNEDGTNAGVLSTAFATVTTGLATTSEKTVTEDENTDNAASSNNAAPDNTLTLQTGANTFTYSLKVNNSSGQAMSRLVLIDNLPEPGDHYPFMENILRGSTAKVVLAEAPDFKVIVKNDDIETVLGAENYTLEFSTATVFDKADWRGEESEKWSYAPMDARSIRIILRDAEGTLIPKGATVEVRFTCRFDDDADCGAVAWNSFGYCYQVNSAGVNVELEAAPLAVGVKTPLVPEVKKVVTDRTGVPSPLAAATDFSFLVYEGEALENAPTDAAELKAALTTAERTYHTFTVTIPADASESEYVKLKETDDWKWIEGETYTIVELVNEDEYAFESWNNSETTQTFTYSRSQSLRLTATNIRLLWNLQLTKVDVTDTNKVLGGAEFALYSLDTNEGMTDAEYDALSNEVKPSRTVTYDGRDWHLVSVVTTDANGNATWENLAHQQYYVEEFKAPKGYYLPATSGVLADRDGETVFLSVTNEAIPYALPETGGEGTTPFYVAGAILVLSACALYIVIWSKKRRISSKTKRKGHMKVTLKKGLSALLSLLMFGMLLMPVAATDSNTLIIENTKSGHNYEVYQIFTGTYHKEDGAENGNLSNIEWGDGVDGAALLEELKVVEMFKDCTDAAAVAYVLESFGEDAETMDIFAEFVSGFLLEDKAIDDFTEAASTGKEGTYTYTLTDLADGYYLIKDADGSVTADGDAYTKLILKMVSDVTVTVKADAPSLTKKIVELVCDETDSTHVHNDETCYARVDANTASMADTITFELKATIPEMDGYEDYTFTMIDILQNSFVAPLGEDLVVTIAGEVAEREVDYTAGLDLDTNTVTIDFVDFINHKEDAGEKVIVTYKAQLQRSDDVVVGTTGNVNKAYLEYSNNPQNIDEIGKTPEDVTITYCAGLKLNKYALDAAGNPIPLEDAWFQFTGEKVGHVKTIGKYYYGIEGAYCAISPDFKVHNVYDEEMKVYLGISPRDQEVQNARWKEGWQLFVWDTPISVYEWAYDGSYAGNTFLFITPDHFRIVPRTLGSNDKGELGIAGLAEGVYTATEIKAPNGYNLLEQPLVVNIKWTPPEQVVDGTELCEWTATAIINDKEIPLTVEDGIAIYDVENKAGPVLPETGGEGTTPFYVAGAILVLSACALYIVIWSKKRRISSK